MTTVPVSGTVSVRGKPLEAGRIFFERVSKEDGRSSPEGEIKDGKFSFPATSERDGIAVGRYLSAILDPRDDAREPRPRLGLVQLETTIFEVTANGPNKFGIDITARDLDYAVVDD